MQSRVVGMQPDSKPGRTDPITDPAGPRLSMSRERTNSMFGATTLAAPPSVSPEPAYIAASAASQIITSDHQTQTDDWFEEGAEKGDPEKATVSPASLTLINAFLDQLLFSFLASARSTSIAALRPAVSEVLKPRLAKEAINGADQELEEFLGGGDEEELSAFHNGLEPRGPWDLHLVWSRTRLRCMVYTRLGDMEEEDEEAFVEHERAEAGDEGLRRLSRDLGIVSPAAAIFLTSILEFIGEQVLIIAGEAAYARQEARTLKELGDTASGSSDVLRVVIENSDMEKLAFNTTFGRLWRSWRKRVRTPSMLGARTRSREFGRGKGSLSPTGSQASRKASISEADEASQEPDTFMGPSFARILPRRPEADPATAKYTEESRVRDDIKSVADPERTISSPRESGKRPRSEVLHPNPNPEPPARDGPEPKSLLKAMQRRRSSSLPALQPVPWKSPLVESYFTPSTFKDQLRSFQEDETPPAVGVSRTDSHSPATTPDVHNATPKVDESPHNSTQLEPGLDGMSKEEFDKHMLALVRDSESPATNIPNSNMVRREVSPKDVGPKPSHAGVVGQVNAVNGKAPPTDDSPSESPNSQGAPQDTTAYWREKGDLPRDDVPQSSHHAYLRGDEGLAIRSMQGEGPRTPSSNGDKQEYGRMWERQAPYSYHGPAASHTNKDARVSGTQREEPKELPLHGAHSSGHENGVPPLTPLRELMEAAHDTSDDASSLAPSYEASKADASERFHHAGFPRTEPFSPQILSQAKPASKLSDLRSKLPAVNTGTERAAVQRVLPSPVSAREPLTPVPRTSTGSNRDVRPIHTSSSSASHVSQKLKGLVGRESSDGRRPTTSRQSSEGSSSITSDKRSVRTPKADEAQRSFDQLIRSDETIQYTLTPQNMRKMEAPDSPRWSPHTRTDTAEMADFFRNTAREQPSTSRPIVSPKAFNGLAANPMKIAKTSEPPSMSPPAPASTSTPAKPSSRPTTSHSHSGLAREAKINIESTRDFADFLRSTGPSQGAAAEAQVHQQNGPPVAAPKPLNALPTKTQPTSGHGPPKSSKQNPVGSGQQIQQPPTNGSVMQGESARPTPLKNWTPKLQAREATVPRATTADLVDFIRQGPTDLSEGRLRLPRTGDPARPFGDANGFTKGINGRPSEGDKSRLSVASTQMSSVPSKSVHSVNSRTGLLDSGSPGRDDRHRASDSIENRPERRDEPPRQLRRQHRNKDPYAIDTDSEGDDDSRTPQPNTEESLIDFLNSVKPPPSPPATRTASSNGSSLSKSVAPVKNQYPSTRDRLIRGGAKTKAVPKQLPMGVPSITRGQGEARQRVTNPVQGRGPAAPRVASPTSSSRGRSEPTQGNRGKSQAPQLPPLNPRETSPHLVSQVGSKLDTYRITQPTYAAHVDRERNGGACRTPTQHYQARGNRDQDHGLSDLADFLRNSEPPTAPMRVDSPPVKEKEKESGFGRMFSRKRKNSRA